MYDKAYICQRALSLLGDYRYTEGTPGYVAANLHWDAVFTQVLALHDWSFSRRRRVLLPDADGLGYSLPPDCARIVELRGLRNWRRFGDRIEPEDVSRERMGEIVLVYSTSSLARRGEFPEGHPLVLEGMVRLLAAYCAVFVQSDHQLRLALEAEARSLLAEAMLSDSRQDASADQNPLDDLNHSILD